MTCRFCRTEIHPAALKCAACGSWVGDHPPVREWIRPRAGRMIAGVCRGFADRFGLPVAAVRLAFLLSLCLGAMGFIVYVACWIAMPNEPQPVYATWAPPAPAQAAGPPPPPPGPGPSSP